MALLVAAAAPPAAGHIDYINRDSPFNVYKHAANRPGSIVPVTISLRYYSEPDTSTVGRLTSSVPWVRFEPSVVYLSPAQVLRDVTAFLTLPAGLAAGRHKIPFEVADGIGSPVSAVIDLLLWDPDAGLEVESNPAIVYIPPGTRGRFTGYVRFYAHAREGTVAEIAPLGVPSWQGSTWFKGVGRAVVPANSWGRLGLGVDASVMPDGSIHTITLPLELFTVFLPLRRMDLTVEFWKTRPRPNLRFFPEVLEFEVEEGKTPPPQTLNVSLIGEGGVGYSVFARGQGGWLSVQTPEPLVPATVVVHVDPARKTSQTPGELEISAGGYPRPLGTALVVEVPRRQPPGQTIPHIADGGGFTTSLILTNPHATPETVRIEALTGDGRPWPLRFQTGVAGDPVVVPPGGSVALETLGETQLPQSGWARVSSAREVAGTVLFRRNLEQGIQESAMPLRRTAPARFLFPFDETGGMLTGLAISNSHPGNAATLRILAFNEGGQPFHTAALPGLAALSHRAFVLSELMPELKLRKGSIELLSSGGTVGAVPLRFTPEGVLSSVEGHGLFETPPLSGGHFLFPHIAAGGGFSSTLQVSNLEAETARVRITGLAASAGTAWPWPQGMNGAEIELRGGDTRTIHLPPVGDSPVSGLVRVDSDRRVGGMVLFERKLPGQLGQAAAVPLMPAGGLLMAPFDNTGGLLTAIALANAHPTEGSLFKLKARDAEGQVIGSGQILLPAEGHRAVPLTDLLPAVADRWGTLEIEVTGGAGSAIALRFLPNGAFTSVQVTRSLSRP